jgi:hypothetical protein
MTLPEFVNAYNGKKVDFDGVYGAQCVDLFRQYCKDVWNTPHLGAVEGASQLFRDYERLPQEQKYLHRIPFDIIDQNIQSGDALVWAPSNTNKWGHVAILIACIDGGLQVFEQDGFAQDGAKITVRHYDRLYGALRRRG